MVRALGLEQLLMLDSLDTLIGFALIFAVVSLLITIVVQIFTSVFNLRGKNLAWGIAEAFEAIAPELKAEVGGGGKKLADHLLHDPLISDFQLNGIVGKASAVRGEELFDLLHRIATGKKNPDPNNPKAADQLKNDVIVLFKNLGVPAYVFELTAVEKGRLQKLKAQIAAQLASLSNDPEKQRWQAEAQRVEELLNNAAANAEESASRWLALGEMEIQKIYQKFEHWFETGEERSQEWFTTHARLITGAAGLLAAFALQLDTIEIYKLVSSNRQLRDSLVAQTKSVLDQGEKVLKERRAVLATALQAIATSSNAFLTNVVVAQSDTVGTVKAKIRETAANRSTAEVDKVLENLDQQIATAVKTNLNEYSGEYNAMAKSLDKTGFELFPKEGWRWGQRDATGEIDAHYGEHFLGMVFSALLLSLGAPFWFNTLKSLASLRSSVAKNISEEDKAQQKCGKIDQPGKAPATVK